MKNKILCILFSTSVIFFILSDNIFAGPPPGASQYTGTASSGGLISSKKSFSLSFGNYSPSLKTINNELKYFGYSGFNSRMYYDIGFGSAGKSKDNSKTNFGFSYWTAFCNNEFYGFSWEQTLSLYVFQIKSTWELGRLTNMISHTKNIRPSLGFIIRDILMTLSEKYMPMDQYNTSLGMMLDFGPCAKIEFFPIQNSNSFSLTLNLDYILYFLPILPLQLFDSSFPDAEYGAELKTHTGKNLTVDTNGSMITLGINFYY